MDETRSSSPAPSSRQLSDEERAWPSTRYVRGLLSLTTQLDGRRGTVGEVAAELGHGVQTLERHYARIFADYDPAKRTSAEVAIRQARAAVAGKAA